MRIHVVYDADGQVIGAGVPLPPAYDSSQPRSGPTALEGQHVALMELPDELADVSLHEAAGRLKVDTSKKAHRLVATD
jgi:hypothetical protein